MRWRTVAVVALTLTAACTPSEGPESIPLPTSADTTSTTTTTTTLPPPTTLQPPAYEATIRRTTDGVAHIRADDVDGLAYGQGRVSAEDHACTLLDQVLKIYGQRAAVLGPGSDGTNIESDFAWRAIDIVSVAGDDFDDAPATVRTGFEAFTAGWNDHLAEVGATGLTGWCTGADWVRPLEPVEVYAYARSTALLASSARLSDFIPSAQPPVAGAEPSGFVRVPDQVERPDFGPADRADMGSNGWAIGRDRTATGSGGMLLANPHFPWEGELRFHEMHLTVPGEIDVYGAQLVGLPGIGIGFTDGVAWTHTVSSGKRFTGYQLTLDPQSPTSYVIDGESRPMISTDHTIEILRADGSVDSETRTLWRSEYGPILDVPGLGWTATTAVTYRDANIDNDEFVEQYRELVRAQSIDDLIELNREYQGVPLFNTVAADAEGNVWYADTSATPNLSADTEAAYQARRFSDPVIQLAYDSGFILLDGSTSSTRWEEVPGARDPGLVPFDEMPMVERTDYVFNANDSFWVPSAEFTLAGSYSIAHGAQGTPLSMRSRRNAAVLGTANMLRMSGDDGKFSGPEILSAAFENGSENALLLRESLVTACQAFPVVPLSELLADDGVTTVFPAQQVDVTQACTVLGAWDGRYDLDRSGPLLWRETMSRFDATERTTQGPLFADAFDPANPTRTPAVANPDAGPLLAALGRAVQVVTAAGFPVDATLGSAQFTERAGDRIPLHGGTEVDGTTNIVSWSGRSSSSEPSPDRGEPVASGSPLRSEGYPVNFGTSFVLAVDFSGGSVEAWSLLTYGQTGDRESPLFESQTIRFSAKDWRPVAFSEDQIVADPDLTETVVSGD